MAKQKAPEIDWLLAVCLERKRLSAGALTNLVRRLATLLIIAKNDSMNPLAIGLDRSGIPSFAC